MPRGGNAIFPSYLRCGKSVCRENAGGELARGNSEIENETSLDFGGGTQR